MPWSLTSPPRCRRQPSWSAAWVRLALGAILALTAFLTVWGLDHNGFANTYYAAAAQAAAADWRAMFFGALDAPGWITIDKPPLSIWVMGLSVRVFGLSAWSLLLPQALMGVATVGILFAAVRRWTGARAGLLAALVLAITPVAVLIFRFDDPDALLTLLLVAAAWSLTRGIDTGRMRWLLLSGVLVGLGFQTKFLQAYLVLPAFGLVLLVGGVGSLARRIAQPGRGRHRSAHRRRLVGGGGGGRSRSPNGPSRVAAPPAGHSTCCWVTTVSAASWVRRAGRCGSGHSRGAGSLFGGAAGPAPAPRVRPGTRASAGCCHWRWCSPWSVVCLAIARARRTGRRDRSLLGYLLWGGWLVTMSWSSASCPASSTATTR